MSYRPAMRADLINTIPEAETPMSGRAFTRIAALVAVLTFAFALPAAAQSPTTQTYAGEQGDVLGSFEGGGQDDVVPGPAAPAGDGGEAPTNPKGGDNVPTE